MNSEIQDVSKQIAELQHRKRGLVSEIKSKDTANMTQAELKSLAMTLPPIREDLWIDMQEYGFVTGSSMFGCASPADIDVVCQLPAYAFIDSCCAVACGICTREYMDDDDAFIPLYGNRDGNLYNIICIGNQGLFDAWKAATNYISDAVRENDFTFTEAMQVKWKRVRLFRALTDIFQPVKPLPLHRELSRNDAWKYDKCMRCGREAIHFTTQVKKVRYNETGICERCQYEQTM